MDGDGAECQASTAQMAGSNRPKAVAQLLKFMRHVESGDAAKPEGNEEQG